MKTLLIALSLISTQALAGSPYLEDRNTGKYLGNLNANEYDSDSVSNRYGRYGSEYSPDSINNPYSKWGSPYSSDSVNNPYSSGSVIIRGR